MTGEACHVMMKHRRGAPPLHLASQVSTRSYFKQACVYMWGCGRTGGEKGSLHQFPLPTGRRTWRWSIRSPLFFRGPSPAQMMSTEKLFSKKGGGGGPTQGTDRMDATTSTSATHSASIFSKRIDGYAMQVVQGDHTNEYSKTTRMQVLVGSTHMHDTLLMTCGTVGRYSS